MRWRSIILLIGGCLMLTACGSSRPIYSGHEESTEGVPGYVAGKKQSPFVKLGQSYKVDGVWYVPHFQPDYDETGLASWYGPGFHGGATANGETFDKHSMTAAHKTLPLPSIVKVTMVDTGKSAYVRINDRGPFVNDRIIDLSYGAAKEIGLLQKGVGKVRVQYMLAESQRFADLLAQGRSPDSIDIAQEVLPYGNGGNTQIASWMDHLNPISTAHAEEPVPSAPAPAPMGNMPMDTVASSDLPAPAMQVAPTPPATNAVADAAPASSPFAVMSAQDSGPPPATASPPPSTASPPLTIAAREPPPTPSPEPPAGVASLNAMYVQVGSYSQQGNAVAMVKRVSEIGPARITITQNGDATLYRVRLGPYENPDMADEVLDRVKQQGIADARFVRP